jgi:hypothetical protein
MAGIFISYRRDDSQGFAGRMGETYDLCEEPDMSLHIFGYHKALVK